MPDEDLAAAALVAAASLHLGFQATVTLLVYPALARSRGAGWEVQHPAHTRSVTPLVVVAYGAMLAACAWALLLRPDDVAVWVTAGSFAATAGITATTAAPLHGRLAKGYDEALVARLLRVDRWRLATAVLAFVAAVLALL